ncbi:MAG: tripartite tricarboxylate transporter substrate-binding protein, partial [Treponema sp.]|nr:tripartite tricarboxylate transporter substrate-binding protein [Treponema sp.]
GSGQENSSRQMEKAIRTNNIIPNPIQFTYKAGGNTGVALQWLKTQKGRSDLIMYASSQLIMTPLQMDVGAKREDLTDIAFFGESFQFLWVTKEKAAKEGWKTFADVVKSGKPVSFTMNGVGSPEDLTIQFLKKKIPGADFRAVPVSGDGEGMTQLLGGHVDIFINELAGGGTESYRVTGDIIALACTAGRRSIFAPAVPTLKEMGYDFSMTTWPVLMGPPGMSKEAIAFWQDVAKKIFDSKEHTEFQNLKGVEPVFKTGKEMADYLDNYKKEMIALFNIAGYKLVPNP